MRAGNQKYYVYCSNEQGTERLVGGTNDWRGEEQLETGHEKNTGFVSDGGGLGCSSLWTG